MCECVCIYIHLHLLGLTLERSGFEIENCNFLTKFVLISSFILKLRARSICTIQVRIPKSKTGLCIPLIKIFKNLILDCNPKNLNPVPDFLQGLRSFCQISESRFCFRSPAWVFLSALAKEPSKMAMAGEDLDNACKQSA